MMLRSLAFLGLGLGLSCLFGADDAVPQKVEVSKTEHVEFPAGGLLRLKGSAGEVFIDGEDRADVEITTIKTTRDTYTAANRAQGTKLLNEVSMKAERRGDEVVVTTTMPHRIAFSIRVPWSDPAKIDLTYQIKVPRTARIVIQEDNGEFHLSDVTADIRAIVHNGTVTLDLPEDAAYAIDARSRLGDVISDYSGPVRRQWWSMAHSFANSPSAGAHKIYVRVAFGDIILRKVTKSATAQ